MAIEKAPPSTTTMTTRHHHYNWAAINHSTPSRYCQPSTLQSLQSIVADAHTQRAQVTVVGCAHTPSDLTTTTSTAHTWLVNLDRMNRILHVNEETGIVEVEAGIRLYELDEQLRRRGRALPNLGTINTQSLAGAIATATHGSSLQHGLLSEGVARLTLLLPPGNAYATDEDPAGGGKRHKTTTTTTLIECSPTVRPDLFRAALVHLGAMGIVVGVSIRTVPDFNMTYSQSLHPLASLVELWDRNPDVLWARSEYVRVWWWPYSRKCIWWRGERTLKEPDSTPLRSNVVVDTLLYIISHAVHRLLMLLTNLVPLLAPWLERILLNFTLFITPAGPTTQPGRQALTADCMYSQYVNEWAIPLHRGPEALRRLDAWLNRAPTSESRIPVELPSRAGMTIHAPIEVRVSQSQSSRRRHAVKKTSSTTVPSQAATDDADDAGEARPYLDTTFPSTPTLYLNTTYFRPFNRDPPGRQEFNRGFEYLMRELGGRPHWAKNFHKWDEDDVKRAYSGDSGADATLDEQATVEARNQGGFEQWKRVRAGVDPEGMFLNQWHRRVLGIQPLGQ